MYIEGLKIQKINLAVFLLDKDPLNFEKSDLGIISYLHLDTINFIAHLMILGCISLKKSILTVKKTATSQCYMNYKLE